MRDMLQYCDSLAPGPVYTFFQSNSEVTSIISMDAFTAETPGSVISSGGSSQGWALGAVDAYIILGME